jgi:hypothetical protein
MGGKEKLAEKVARGGKRGGMRHEARAGGEMKKIKK